MMSKQIPYFKPSIGEEEIAEVVETLRSGWLTTGSRVHRFELEFAAAIGAEHAIALNSCTAALHLAVEALNLKPNQAVLVPTMTFAATAEVVRYQGGIPLLVDCDPITTNIDLEDAERKLSQLRTGDLPDSLPRDLEVVGIMPVHVGGLMLDVDSLQRYAVKHKLWIVEDAAHAFPAAWRAGADKPWQMCGGNTAAVTCFSFYANKTITTGEGGMAVTNDNQIAERMRCMSLHGLTKDAWARYSSESSWDYQICAPGFKYNLTDIAAAIGLHQLNKAEEMRRRREEIALRYLEGLDDIDEIELPPVEVNRIQSWHLFPIKLHLPQLRINRNDFIEELKSAGVGYAVHWRPLHLHEYYRESFGWRPEDLPVATTTWERLISLPLFPSMADEEVDHVTKVVRSICACYARQPVAFPY